MRMRSVLDEGTQTEIEMKTKIKALATLAIALSGVANATDSFKVARMVMDGPESDREVTAKFNRCTDAIVGRTAATMTGACDAALRLTIERADRPESLLFLGYVDQAAVQSNKLGIAAAYSNAALAHWLTGDAATAIKLIAHASTAAPQLAFVLSNGQLFAKQGVALTPLASN
jgi:membrane-bound inhibitor of C-type lysozyme